VICDLCLALGGRFNANNECCQIRLVAGLPQTHRLQAFAKIRRESGAEAEAQFREKVRVEYARQRESRREKIRAIQGQLKAA